MRTTPFHPADTRLHGRWLVLALAAWAVLSSGTLLAFAFSLPVYVTLLQTNCTGTGCVSGQPDPTLHGLAFSPGSYVTFLLVCMLVSLLVACTMSGLLAWRQLRDWLALLVALMFILLVTIESISPLEPPPKASGENIDLRLFSSHAKHKRTFCLNETVSPAA